MSEIQDLLFDSRSVFQVIGCLMREPTLLDEYRFDPDDFYDLFNKIIYGAINNLYSEGARVIDKIAIDNYLSNYKEQYAVFTQRDGLQYAEDCKNLAEPKNFPYYYQQVKKFAYLRYADKNGLDIRPLYDYSLTGSELEKERDKFNKQSVEDLIEKVESKFVTEGKAKYMISVMQKEYQAGAGIRELVESLQESPDFGIPLLSPFLNTIYRGARFGALYLLSAPSGVGKTRIGMMNMVYFSVPHHYDNKEKKWVHKGFSNPSLIISTELERNELQTIILAQISGVSEDKILSWKMTKQESIRVEEAMGYMEMYPLYFVILEDYSQEQIFNIIKKYHRDYGVNYVYFDYIQTTPGLLSEMTKNASGIRLREDQILYQFVSSLKRVARLLNINIISATQLSGTYHEGPRDETILRGAKAMADKIDCGEIIMNPTPGELKAVDDYIERKIKMVKPNKVKHVYKCRGGKYTKLKIFCHLDLGAMTVEDLFATDANNVLIDIPLTEINLGEDAPVMDVEATEIIEQVIEDNSVDMGSVSEEEIYNKLSGQNSDSQIEDESGLTEAQLAMRKLGF